MNSQLKAVAIGMLVLSWLGVAASAQTEPNFVSSPTPSNAELFSPEPEVPSEIAAWYGRWEGRWDGKWPLVIAVTGFEQRDGVWLASVQYYYKKRVSEPYRVGRSTTDLVRVTGNSLMMNNITVYRHQRLDQIACADGAFSDPKSAILTFRTHNSDHEDKSPGIFETLFELLLDCDQAPLS